VAGEGARRFDVARRRRRLAVRHALAPGHRVHDPVEAAERMVALHATDPATVHLSALVRTDRGDVALTEHALYEARSLVRLLGMRRSMFVVPLDVAPVVQAACSRTIAATQRRLLLKELVKAKISPDADAWLAGVEDATVAALEQRGTATAVQLASDVPLLKTTLTLAEGKSYGATVNITSRVLFLLGAQARIVRGRPRGSWTSTQYVWSPMDTWLDGGLPVLDPQAAKAELIRRWLWTFGPAPVSDITWWTGLGIGDIRKALAALDVTEVDLGGQLGVVLQSDVDDDPAEVPPWVALLPGLDPTAMGWQQRDWYLGDYARHVTDRTGNIGPTIWWNGRVAGAWAQRKSGEIVFRLLEDIGGEGRRAVEDAAAELTRRIGDVVFMTRFPAPLDKELRG
jgi:hypothetical protein